jgi:hypothetical protein
MVGVIVAVLEAVDVSVGVGVMEGTGGWPSTVKKPEDFQIFPTKI